MGRGGFDSEPSYPGGVHEIDSAVCLKVVGRFGAHRHVGQRRLKLAGQHQAQARPEKLVQLRAAQATVGPASLHGTVIGIRRRAEEFRRCG